MALVFLVCLSKCCKHSYIVTLTVPCSITVYLLLHPHKELVKTQGGGGECVEIRSQAYKYVGHRQGIDIVG